MVKLLLELTFYMVLRDVRNKNLQLVDLEVKAVC